MTISLSAVTVSNSATVSGQVVRNYVALSGRYSFSLDNLAAVSSDGVTWTSLGNAFPTGAWADVTYGAGTFVAVGFNGVTARSTDGGLTWTSGNIPGAGQFFYTMAYGSGVFVTVNFRTANAYSSPDGITWTQQALPANTTWGEVKYGGGNFVAVAGGSNITANQSFYTNFAATSPDGITWTQRTLPVVADWRTLVYGNNTWIATSWSRRDAATGNVVSGSNIAARSTDNGQTWANLVLPLVAEWQSGDYGGNAFVLGFNGGFYRSTDLGNTWYQTFSNLNPRVVSWQQNQFTALISRDFTARADSNIVLNSSDGLIWQQSGNTPNSSADSGWYGLAYGSST